jgi:GTP diphosphokinase / guanosine-3',5'-bis(diphosphate) 3'-diphosphatase
VEIVTSPEKNPTRSWLGTVATSDARHQIKRWLNARSRAKSLLLGKKLWERALGKFDLPGDLKNEANLLRRVSEVLNKRFGTMNELYGYAGMGKVVLDRSFLEKLSPSSGIPPKKATFIERMVSKVARKPSPGILIKSLDDQMISLAKCCSPIKGEPASGYITVGKGITVHSQRCPLVVKEILDSQRMVDVAWDDSFRGNFRAKLLIKVLDSPGMLAKIATLIAHLEGNITRAQIETFANGLANLDLEVSIRDILHLERILEGLRQIKEISSAERG